MRNDCWLFLLLGFFFPAVSAGAEVVLARAGEGMLPIVASSAAEPAAELRLYLNRMLGKEYFAIAELNEENRSQAGIFVGMVRDFPELAIENATSLGSEGFIIRTENDRIYLLGHGQRGVSHAVVTLLHHLGCRWLFPGKAWEVVPRQETIRVSLNLRETPDFPTQRRIWYGFGAYAQNKQDWEDWMRHNKMGSDREIGIGHTWAGLHAEKDFADHPEWFAQVDGKRQPTKPCYSHPQVIARAIAAALAQAESGKQVISVSPPDGLGYCECNRCQEAAGVKETFVEHNSLFGKRDDGEVVNVTSETVFGLANAVAEATAKKYPQVLIGCYAYSAYSHPPSFDLHPNVYLQTTTAYRRTPLTLEQQLAEFGAKTRQFGIREYYSVYQWDWDYPDPGKLTPSQLKQDLQFFQRHGVTAMNAEASCNWGPRGLGYYLAANLMWNTKADTEALMRDFYEQAFGPAAPAMQRYYVRWYGEDVAVLEAETELPAKSHYLEKGEHNLAVLREAYRDLNEAARLTARHPAERGRVDHLRIYVHYLLLRHHLEEATNSGDSQSILAAIEAETRFGGRIAATNMIHTRPLVGKAFARRFRKYEDLLADLPAASQAGQGWRSLAMPPSAEELEQIWRADLRELELQ